MKAKISFQMIGILSTLALVTASIAPKALHVPAPMRPWVFMFTIAWTLLVVSGVFVP